MIRTALREGMAVRARRPAQSRLGPDQVEAGERGAVIGIGPVWDWTDQSIFVEVNVGGRIVAHEVAFANNLWEPA